MVSTGHSPLDDRIYYKEALSLSKKYSQMFIIAPYKESDIAVKKENGIRFVSLRKATSILRRLINIPAAVRAVIKIKPQVCHFHDYEFIFVLPFLRLFSKCKIIYDVHEVYPEMVEVSRKVPRLLRPYLAKFVDLSEKIFSRLTDYIVTSDDSISKRFNNNRHVTTVFNYPRLSIFVPDQDKQSQLKERYKERTPIIYQGGISEDRGLFKMFDAMHILKDKRPDIILLLVGEMYGDLLKRSKDEIRKKGLQNNVDIVGWVSHKDVVNYIYVSKVGLIPLLPTKKFLKNIPIKQFEYMACGIPVLGANLPPIASYVNSSGCGKVFDSTSADALASGVTEILQSESEWKRMSEAGRKAVQDSWNWNKMEEKLFAVYEHLLGAA